MVKNPVTAWTAWSDVAKIPGGLIALRVTALRFYADTSN